jgi:transcriptional regulator
VPTWVYQAVHVRGTIEPIGSGAPLENLMEHIIKCSETRNGTNWQMDRIERSDIERMLPRIIGFRLTIQKITGISKMEQGQSEKNERNLIEHFQSGLEDAGPQIAKVLRAQI